MATRKGRAKQAVQFGQPPHLGELAVARALREVAQALGTSLELDELLELVLTKVRELVRADGAWLLLLDEKRRQLVSRGDGVSPRVSLELGDDCLGQVVLSGRARRVTSFAAEGLASEWDAIVGGQSESAIILPLKNNLSRTVGAVLAVRRSPALLGPFTPEDEEVVAVLARLGAVAIDNSRLLVSLIRKNQQLQHAQDQLMRRVRDLELLFELERSTARAHSQEEIAKTSLERLARACSAEQAILVLAQEGGRQVAQYELVTGADRRGSTGATAGVFRAQVLPVEESILQHALTTRAPVHLDATGAGALHGEHDSYVPPAGALGPPVIRSMMAEVLEGEDAPMGAIGLVNKSEGPFTAEDSGLLRLVGANISTAVRLFHASRAREREERLSAVGRLLSQVVHDLKSPLTVISGYVQLMTEEETKDARARYAGEILKQFEALGAMQREVLAFARGETKVFVRRVLLDRFLADLKDVLEKEMGRPNVGLEITGERKLIVHLDSERLTRALQNLVRNAVEAMGDAGGQVRIEAASEGADLRLRVSDTGPGVPPEIADRLFESFVTSGKAGGTGLGLAIVKRIVEEHGGTIRLGPPAPGASFVMTFPNAVERRK